jgi:RNA polymerase sigma-70 factor (sigma-E family)
VRLNDESAYREFVVARLDGWRRTAYLVCRDWHAADDLVGATIERLYLRWHRFDHVNDLDSYVRGMIVRAWLDELRRPWRLEVTVGEVFDSSATTGAPGEASVVDRITTAELLTSLTPRKRAVVVLRFYCDLSVEETAELLGVTEGTVKSQTAKALDALRAVATTHVAARPQVAAPACLTRDGSKP